MGVFRRRDADQLFGKQPERLIVLDVETTGVYNADRIVEIATVTLSPGGEIIDEWDTLINPERDVGPTYIHGITALMVCLAPRFDETASALADRLHGAILVGHNLAFDSRMLANEYARLGAELNPGTGVCTLSRCGGRLEVACARHGISIEHHHRALADARATARLFLAAACEAGGCMLATLSGLSSTGFPRTLRRDVVAGSSCQMPYIARLAACSYDHQARGAALTYLDMLDRSLNDLTVSDEEWTELSCLAATLGMTVEDVSRTNEGYLRELIAAAARDGRITDQEYVLLQRVTGALRLDEHLLEEAVARHRVSEGSVVLKSDMAVCFTGSASYADGTRMDTR